MTRLSPEECLIEVGKLLMERRGLTHSELSTLMVSILAVVAELVAKEGDVVLKTALAELESKGQSVQ